FKLIYYLLAFKFQLSFIVDMLPFASAANPKMLTKRRHPVLGELVEFDGLAFHKATLASGDPNVHEIPWSHIRYKNHLPFIMGHAFSFRCNPLHPQVFQDLVL